MIPSCLTLIIISEGSKESLTLAAHGLCSKLGLAHTAASSASVNSKASGAVRSAAVRQPSPLQGELLLQEGRA